MNITFDEIVNSKIENLEEYIISPASPYLLCDHFISIELNIGNPHYINSKIAPKANDLLKNKNYNDIKNLEIIQIFTLMFLDSLSVKRIFSSFKSLCAIFRECKYNKACIIYQTIKKAF